MLAEMSRTPVRTTLATHIRSGNTLVFLQAMMQRRSVCKLFIKTNFREKSEELIVDQSRRWEAIRYILY